jgi:hypothetical protein
MAQRVISARVTADGLSEAEARSAIGSGFAQTTGADGACQSGVVFKRQSETRRAARKFYLLRPAPELRRRDAATGGNLLRRGLGLLQLTSRAISIRLREVRR